MEKEATHSEKKVDAAMAALPDGEVKRIFIGGVGAAVTADDMDKTFSPLGKVHAVEFIRTNGRSFAYMNFEPSSGKSLAKLFSTYNGCKWKGGKLKLEMAKEHYLARLKQEWAEDAKLESAPPINKENLDFGRSQFSNQENLQIRIFFPKLRKVKSLPFKGTGKHKYSFQRIEASPIPIHFCDCEEHSKVPETTIQKYLPPLRTVVHEKERSIMTNVINKLMGGDNNETLSHTRVPVATDANTLNPPYEDINSKATEEVSDNDVDNLVMNIGAGVEDDILSQLKGGMTSLMDEVCHTKDSGFGKPQYSAYGLTEKKAESGKRKKSELTNNINVKLNKRACPGSVDELSKPEPALAIPQNVSSSLSEGESLFPSSLVTSKGPSHTPKVLFETQTTEIQTEPTTDSAQPSQGQSWVQKSSWKDLVRGTGSSLFSISTLLTGITSTSQAMPKSNALATNTHPTAEKSEPDGEKSKPKTPQNLQITKQMSSKAPLSAGVLEKDSNKTSHLVEDKPSKSQTSGVQENSKGIPAIRIGEVCPFMRSSESEQQWSKAKATLSGYLKRKSNEGNASKFPKGIAPGKR